MISRDSSRIPLFVPNPEDSTKKVCRTSAVLAEMAAHMSSVIHFRVSGDAGGSAQIGFGSMR